jgi:hypothetical protein
VEDGFFHADPHPGNFFIEQNGAIGLIDFGMVGVLDERTQDLLAELLIAINHQDADRLVDVFLDLGVTRKRIDRALVRRDIERLLSTYWGLPLGEVKVTVPVIDRLESNANRIVLGVIAAAFINGLAVLASVYRPPGSERWAWVVFAFGFLSALLLGIYLAWTILRPKRI